MSSLFTSEITVENLPLTVDGSGVTQPVSGTVAVSNFPATQPVSGPLTDTQLRATAVPVSGPLTDAQLRASAVPVSGPLTDTQLRATPVPVSGTVTTSPVVSSSSTVVQVVVPANTNTTLKVANASRKRLVIFAPKSTIYVKLGVGASLTSFSYAGTSANSTLEVDIWTGQVDVFSTVAQTINVTELV